LQGNGILRRWQLRFNHLKEQQELPSALELLCIKT
jgi:hypothetical protein